MWTNMILADEHTWDSYNSVSDSTSKEAVDQLAVKELYPVKAAALADFITRNSMASIANSISAGSGNVIVFNTLNWARNGVVSLDLNNSQELVDTTTGQVVPVEVLSGNKDFHQRPLHRRGCSGGRLQGLSPARFEGNARTCRDHAKPPHSKARITA